MSIVIQAEKLSKAYRIGVKEEVPDSFVGALSQLLKAPWKNFQDLRRLDTFGEKVATYDESVPPDPGVYWALKNVSFEVSEGDVLGVIGKNGAGKSTLLKVLSRITEPTSGRAVIRGRVSSLLEVGTGFHPELSGRENVYLNGTILGMTKAEIDGKFDQIVDFSGIEKFLDTPIKRYSSGMKVRLAFAVAAHLEPEILIIDEVLAVGDVEFQKKCIGKMQEVSKTGRTVVFVSHDFPSVQSLCTKALIMTAGQSSELMTPSEAIRLYSKTFTGPGSSSVDFSSQPIDKSTPQFSRIDLLVNGAAPEGPVFVGDRISFYTEFESPYPFNPMVEVAVTTATGARLFAACNQWCGNAVSLGQVTRGALRCDLGAVPLMPGGYKVQVALLNEYRAFHVVREAFSLEIDPADCFGTGKLPKPEHGPIIWGGEFTQLSLDDN